MVFLLKAKIFYLCYLSSGIKKYVLLTLLLAGLSYSCVVKICFLNLLATPERSVKPGN